MNTRKQIQKREGVKRVRLSIEVDEATWRELRNAAETERSAQGRASINALVNRLIAEHLKARKKGGK